MDRSSLKEYTMLVADRWRVMLIGLVVFLVGIGLDIGQTTGIILVNVPVEVARTLWIVALIITGIVAPFQAFQKVRRERDEAWAQLGAGTSPLLAESQLRFSNLHCGDFGHGGEDNFGGLDASKWYGYVTALAHAESEMTITRIALILDGQEAPTVRWNAYEVGVGNYLCSFPVEIARTIGAGRHEARIVAFASGKSWRSPDFMVEVPSH